MKRNKKEKSIIKSVVETLVRELPAPSERVIVSRKYRKEKYKKIEEY